MLTDISPTAALDAERLLAHVLDRGRAAVLARLREPLAATAAVAFEAVVTRRAAGEPVAYIIGRSDFYRLTLEVTPDTLIPRPETELLAEWAIGRARARFDGRESSDARPARGRVRQALDVGTGSGALALALAAHVADLEVHATDVSRAALAVAARNATRLGLVDRVRFHQADLLPPEPRLFDLVVANLPYVAIDDPDLDPEVRRFEPAEALFAGADGLAIIRRLLEVLPPRLASGADLGLEIGWRQGPAAVALVGAALPGSVVVLHEDMAGHDRLVTAESVP